MKYILFLIAIVIAAFSGCKGPTGDDGAIGGQLKGDIYGYVRVWDEKGNSESNRQGVIVKVDGEDITATSDSTGLWTLRNVSAGIHSITAQKPGYSKTVVSNYQFVGGGNAYFPDPLEVIQLPSFTITGITLTGKATDSLGQILSIDINPPAKKDEYRNFLILFGRSESVKVNTKDVVFGFTNSYKYKSEGPAMFSVKNLGALLKSVYNVKSGEKLYVITYPVSGNAPVTYIDPVTNEKVYANIGSPSSVISFEVP